MIEFTVLFRGISLGVAEAPFLPGKPGPGALAALKQDQADPALRPVPEQAQPLWLQGNGGGAAADLGQPFRPVNQVKIPAEFQRPGSSGEQLRQGAAVLPPGQGNLPAGRAAGKIGGIGYAAGKAAGGQG